MAPDLSGAIISHFPYETLAALKFFLITLHHFN